MSRLLPLIAALALVACPPSPEDTDTSADTDTDTDTSLPSAACFDGPVREDRVRTGLLSLPFDTNQNTYAVLSIGVDGAVADTGTRVTMGRNFMEPIRFSPDGHLGISVQDDGSLGVFTVSDDGAVTVVDAQLSGDWYAGDVVFDTARQTVWILDGNWRENGGGLYAAHLDCTTGALSGITRSLPAKKLYAGALRANGDLVVAADNIGQSGDGNDTHVVDLDDGTVTSSVRVYPDNDAIVVAGALVDDTWFLTGDANAFSSTPNRVAIAQVTASGVVANTVLTPLGDPSALVASPWGNAAMLSRAQGDEVRLLQHTGDTWTDAGALGTFPLAANLSVIESGALRGHVYLAHNSGVGHLAFAADGTARALTGIDIAGIPGALGVQP